MKTWISIISFFCIINSDLLACGPYYPYGDDVRFSMLRSYQFPNYGMERFFYTAFAYSNEYNTLTEEQQIQTDENVSLWSEFIGGKADRKAIFHGLYTLENDALKVKNHANAFIRILNQDSYAEALNYLIFAKNCSALNAYFGDPWERRDNVDKRYRNKQIKKALKFAKKTTDPTLKRRYAYLAIRMSFYNSDKRNIKSIYADYFSDPNKTLDAIDYWALHFHIQTQKPSPRRNVDVARVFTHSKEKRFAIHFYYSTEFNKGQTLSEAKNEAEKTAVNFYIASRKLDPAFEELKSYQAHATSEDDLLFLMMREVNKLEDWILTPYYTMLPPTLTSDDISYDTSKWYQVENHVRADRLYAGKLAHWMDGIDTQKMQKKQWWNGLSTYLHFMANETSGISAALKTNMNQTQGDTNLLQFEQRLYALCKLREDPTLNDPIVQKILREESQKGNNKFVFGLARELEYQGNTTDAAFVFSKLNQSDYWNENGSFWRSKKFTCTLYDDFYEDYFDYFDAEFTPNQLKKILKELDNTRQNSDFETWLHADLKGIRPYLLDLLGTKYLRQENLNDALTAFEAVNDSIWKQEPFSHYLNANPFYTDFYTEHTMSDGDTIRYTKKQIIQKLIHYKALCEKTSGDKKAYYCFQVANCYLNMTQYGNSWMMRRYFWTMYATPTGLEDDAEYFQCLQAKHYYLEAKQATSKTTTKALALRMAGRCEKYRLYSLNNGDDFDGSNENNIFEKNKYYKQLKKEYPDHYEPLISNCYSFAEYYAQMK